MKLLFQVWESLMLRETFPMIRRHKIRSPKSHEKIPAVGPLHGVYYLFWSKFTPNSLLEAFPGVSLAVFERVCTQTCGQKAQSDLAPVRKEFFKPFSPVYSIRDIEVLCHKMTHIIIYLLLRCTSGVTYYQYYYYVLHITMYCMYTFYIRCISPYHTWIW